jgi:mannose-6-phosphate isomerase-like protein (cupin superfamily)
LSAHYHKTCDEYLLVLAGRGTIFLAIDTPRRDPKEITFVNPADGTPETFIKSRRLY